MNKLFDIYNLASLIRLNRFDDRIEIFISKITTEPIITVDKDGGANNEFIEFKDSVFGLHFMSNLLESIHFQFGRKNSDYTMLEYPLPMGIRFGQSKSEILNILGSPDIQGGGSDGYFGHIPEWFKFNKDGYAIHMEFFQDSKGVESVTIMAIENK